MHALLAAVVITGLLATSTVLGVSDYAHGFGDDLPWVNWESARDVAKMQRKPIMLIIHKSWCGACQSLKAKFEQKTAQQQLKLYAKHFVISNVEDDDEPWEEEYQPDGKYIPRVIFTSPDGEVLDEIVNDKAEYDGYKYYYTNPAQVMTSMRKVMDIYGLGDKIDTKKKDGKVKKSDDEASMADAKKKDEEVKKSDDDASTADAKKEDEEVKKSSDETEKKDEKDESEKRVEKNGEGETKEAKGCPHKAGAKSKEPAKPPGGGDAAQPPSSRPPSSKPPGKSEL